MNWRSCAVLAVGLISASGLHAQVPAGGEFVVSTSGAAPAVATDAAGNFVVVFTDNDDGDHTGVSAKRYDATGAALGAAFRVNSYTKGCQGNVHALDVASDSAGGLIVVWHSSHCFGQPPQDGSAGGVYAQRYDGSGLPRGAEFRVNTFTTGDQTQPSVSIDGAGNTVVVWTDLDRNFGLFAQRYDTSGTPLGAEFRIHEDSANGGLLPTVASNAAGSFVVVWDKSSGPGVFARPFAPSGMPLVGEFRVDTPVPGAPPGGASVAIDPQGGFVVSWAGDDAVEIRARRFDAVGTPLGVEMVVATSVVGLPAVAAGQDGSFVVAWPRHEGPFSAHVLARRFDSGGLPRGAEFRVTPPDQFRSMPAIAMDPSGNFIIASHWISTVAAQRFGGLAPAAALADAAPGEISDGNGVIEAGESVNFAPSWHNVNGQAQTFDGSALGLSGPSAPGVSYVLHDGVGAYGTAPNGSTIPCSDCYEVGVTSDGPRPSMHWDAQLTERITPDALGQTRVWPLHIGDSFSDVPRSSPYYRSVETMLHGGVTGGCRAAEYCPRDEVTREQMAVFTLVGRHGSGFLPVACSAPIFGDVPASSPYCRFIEELSRRGVSSGCGDGNFCPAQPVTREQMAVFVLKTLDPAIDPPACAPPNIFNDVPEGSPFCRWIEELARRGVVSGCGGGNYCAGSPTTREQMAVIVAQAYGLKLY